MHGIVSVAGKHMNHALAQPLPTGALRFPSKAVAEGLRRELDEAAGFNPFFEARRGVSEHGVAFGVRDDGYHAQILQLAEDIFGGRWDEEFGEFDHQIAKPVDGVDGVIAHAGLDVVDAQVEVAAAMDARLVAGEFVEFLDPLIDERGLIVVLRIGMRGGDNVGGAVRGRNGEHGEAGFTVWRAVVEAVENMAVYIDHFDHGRS